MVKQILHQNIIKELGLDMLPEKEQQEALLRVGKIIFQSVLIRVMEELNTKGKNQLTKLLTEKPDDEKIILDFLKSKIPDLNKIVNEEIIHFKQESLGFMREIKK